VATEIKSQTIPLKDGELYESSYKGNKRTSPSKSSVANVLSTGTIYSIKARPRLTQENKLVRYKFAKAELRLSDAQRNDCATAIDEAYFTLEKKGTGSVVLHPNGPSLKHLTRIREVKSKRHPDKIMVIAVIACPKMLNPLTAGVNDEVARFDPEMNGKVALVRCVEEVKRKRKTYKKVNGVKTLSHDAGETKVVSCTLDGARYRDFLIKDGGILSKVRSYFGPDVEVRFQEDGAPGHGYNNKGGRIPTKTHDEMTAVAEAKRIKVFKQPHNSPELNPLDLGIWFSLQAKVRYVEIPEIDHNSGFVESKIWEAVKIAWDELESRTIWNCWMVKDEILKEIKTSKGEPIVKEPHSGVRTRWGTHPPAE